MKNLKNGAFAVLGAALVAAFFMAPGIWAQSASVTLSSGVTDVACDGGSFMTILNVDAQAGLASIQCDGMSTATPTVAVTATETPQPTPTGVVTATVTPAPPTATPEVSPTPQVGDFQYVVSFDLSRLPSEIKDPTGTLKVTLNDATFVKVTGADQLHSDGDVRYITFSSSQITIDFGSGESSSESPELELVPFPKGQMVAWSHGHDDNNNFESGFSAYEGAVGAHVALIPEFVSAYGDDCAYPSVSCKGTNFNGDSRNMGRSFYDEVDIIKWGKNVSVTAHAKECPACDGPLEPSSVYESAAEYHRPYIEWLEALLYHEDSSGNVLIDRNITVFTAPNNNQRNVYMLPYFKQMASVNVIAVEGQGDKFTAFDQSPFNGYTPGLGYVPEVIGRQAVSNSSAASSLRSEMLSKAASLEANLAAGGPASYGWYNTLTHSNTAGADLAGVMESSNEDDVIYISGVDDILARVLFYSEVSFVVE